HSSLRSRVPQQPALQNGKRPGADQPLVGARRGGGPLERARRQTQSADYEISVEWRAGAVLRSRLRREEDVEIQIRQHVLSAMGGIGHTRAGQGCRGEPEVVRASWWDCDEHRGNRCTVGSAIWLGEY